MILVSGFNNSSLDDCMHIEFRSRCISNKLSLVVCLVGVNFSSAKIKKQ